MYIHSSFLLPSISSYLLALCPSLLPPSIPPHALSSQVRPDGTVDFYPVQFKVYRHTTLPPPAKPSSLPWPIASVFGTLGITSPKPVPSSPLSSAGVISGGTEGGPIQPPLPRRVLYYYAAFIESTTIEEVLLFCIHMKIVCIASALQIEEGSAKNNMKYPTRNKVLSPLSPLCPLSSLCPSLSPLSLSLPSLPSLSPLSLSPLALPCTDE